MTHVANLPAGAMVLGPSAEVCPGQMFTDTEGMQSHSAPRPMSDADIAYAIDEFAQSARMAIEAGFDGIGLPAANGYLIEQFLNANVNKRGDGWGDSPAGRDRFALEVAGVVTTAIGAERVGLRLSPYGVFNGTGALADVDAQYHALVAELSALGLLYLHVLDRSAMGAPPVPASIKADLRRTFDGPFILSGGLDRAGAERALVEGQADLIAFARAYLANPDLVQRMRIDAPLNVPDMVTFSRRDRRATPPTRWWRMSTLPGDRRGHGLPGRDDQLVPDFRTVLVGGEKAVPRNLDCAGEGLAAEHADHESAEEIGRYLPRAVERGNGATGTLGTVAETAAVRGLLRSLFGGENES